MQEGHRVVVGGDPVMALLATAEAAMEDHLLTLRPVEGADGRHQGATGAGPVSGAAGVDVTAVEAERAVVAMPATGDGRTDEGPAAAAFERLWAVGATLFRPRFLVMVTVQAAATFGRMPLR